jgi:hypothetical protein
MVAIVPVYGNVFTNFGGLFQGTTYLFKHKQSLKVARFAFLFFPFSNKETIIVSS